jgi:hypothetical protein
MLRQKFLEVKFVEASRRGEAPPESASDGRIEPTSSKGSRFGGGPDTARESNRVEPKGREHRGEPENHIADAGVDQERPV